MQEEWKLIRNSQCYEVSNFGEVRSLFGISLRKDGKKYTHKSQIIKHFITNNGYCIVPLKRDVCKKKLIHRLVLESFSPTDNMDELDVNHIDGNKQNNKLDNLEWCTKKENMNHARNIGLWSPEKRCGEKHPLHILSEKDVKQIKSMLQNKEYTQHKIAQMFNVSDTTISEIKYGKKWVNI
jgi:hypothetical protein